MRFPFPTPVNSGGGGGGVPFPYTPFGPSFSNTSLSMGGGATSSGGPVLAPLAQGGGGMNSGLMALLLAKQKQKDSMARVQKKLLLEELEAKREANRQARENRPGEMPRGIGPQGFNKQGGKPMYVSYVGGPGMVGGVMNASGPGPGNAFAGYAPAGSGVDSISMGSMPAQSRASLSPSAPQQQNARTLTDEWYDLPEWERVRRLTRS